MARGGCGTLNGQRKAEGWKRWSSEGMTEESITQTHRRLAIEDQYEQEEMNIKSIQPAALVWSPPW
jgi:hypothetical protein